MNQTNILDYSTRLKMHELNQQVVCVPTDESATQCRRLANKYSLPLIDHDEKNSAKYGLIFQDGALQLVDLMHKKYRPIVLNTNQVRRISKRSPLGRAMGRRTKTIADATAGWGGDTLLLARMGFKVIAIERSAAIAALLEDGVLRAKSNADYLDIEHHHGDARHLLPRICSELDAVYLDPMYPAGRKKSVLVARPMKVLREIAGDDIDSEQLLVTTLNLSVKRVVVKRPKFAPPLCPNSLTNCFKNKLARYDVYIRGS